MARSTTKKYSIDDINRINASRKLKKLKAKTAPPEKKINVAEPKSFIEKPKYLEVNPQPPHIEEIEHWALVDNYPIILFASVLFLSIVGLFFKICF